MVTFQYRAMWSIPNAGPAVSTFHYSLLPAGDPSGVLTQVRTFLAANSNSIPNDVTISFSDEVTAHDTATGQLQQVIPVVPAASLTGGNAGLWAGGAGLRVSWLTEGIVAGRRVRGTTFIVPAANVVFDNTGRVTSAVQSAWQAAANTYLTAMNTAGAQPAVWSRPTPTRSGSNHIIVGSAVPGLAATLRGRKY